MIIRMGPVRGVVLVSVMFVSILVGMYVVSSTVLVQGQFGFLKQNRESQLAEEAARSGIEYALARLQENPEWKAEVERVTVDTPGLVVVEGGGNVVGLLRTGDGALAQFRLRFNHQDGPGGDDDLDDPPGYLRFDSPHISGNNLMGLGDLSLYLGDGPNGRSSTLLPYPVPGGMVALVCEGRVGAELARATADDPNPHLERPEAVRVIEEFHRVDEFYDTEPVVSAVSMGGDRILGALFHEGRIRLGDVTGGEAKMRAKRHVDLNDGSGVITGAEGEVRVGDGSPRADLREGITAGEEDINSAFYQVAWDQVQEPREGAGELSAGVYVFWAEQGLRYFDMTYDDYMQKISENPSFVQDSGEPATLPEGMVFVPAGEVGPDGERSDRHRFVITDDIRVTSTLHTSDLTIMPRGGAKEKVLPDPWESEPGTTAEPEQAPGPNDPEFWAGAVAEGDLPKDQEGLIDVLSIRLGEPGLWNSASPGASFWAAPVHHLLTKISPTGGVIHNTYGELSWDADNIYPTQMSEPSAFLDYLFRGRAEIEGIPNPDSRYLEPTKPGGTPGAYNFRVDLLQDIFFPAGGFDPKQLNEIDLEGLGVSGEDLELGPQDFELSFQPQGSEGVRFQGPGDIRFATDVRGQGASIKAEGQIRVVGVGMQFDAGSGEEGPRVSLYAKDDIVLSTLRRNAEGEYYFEGLDLRGVLYSWRDIELRTSDEERTAPVIYLQGSMVAYGGDPAYQTPGQGEGGEIRFIAQNVDLMFDPHYLPGLIGVEGVSAVLAPVSTSYR